MTYFDPDLFNYVLYQIWSCLNSKSPHGGKSTRPILLRTAPWRGLEVLTTLVRESSRDGRIAQWVEWLWNRRVQHWAICSSACSALLAWLTRSAHLFARSLTRSWAHGEKVFVYRMNASISFNFNPLWVDEWTVNNLELLDAIYFGKWKRVPFSVEFEMNCIFHLTTNKFYFRN